MKKIVAKKVITMGMTAVMLAGSLAAGTDASAAKKLSVSKGKITLEVGKKKTIKANMSAKFSVSNKKIVSLKSVKKKQCTVVAKKKGSCTITVKANKQVKKIKVTVNKKTTQAPASNAELVNLTMVEKVNHFGFSMLNQLDEGKNIIISPYSIMMAMTMVDNAADGTSKEEMEKAFGITDLDQWNKEFSEYYKNYMNQPESENTSILRTANSIWKNEQNFSFDSEVQKTYMQKMLELYGAEEKSMDFVNGNPMDQINSWVDEKTEGMIEKLYENPIGENIESVLVNAVYFNGKWQNPFGEGSTWKSEFKGKSGTTEVDMMHDHEYYCHYLEKGSLAVAEFPFKGDNLVMDVVLAKKDASTIEEFAKLSNTEKSALFQEVSQADREMLDVSLPKFKMTYGSKEITGDLKKMGITSIFNAKKAQLPGLRGDNDSNIYVDSVVHQAVIEVDEGGAKAAAATGTMIGDTMVIGKDFDVNKPFVCVLRDKNTNMIYFMGQVEDLTEENQMN